MAETIHGGEEGGRASMTCPRCGGGSVAANQFKKPDGTVWLVRYVCEDPACQHTWADQTADAPTREDRDRERRKHGGR